MSSFTVDGLRKPTHDESRFYFVGLSGGNLLARTNTQERPWQGCPTEPGWSGRKHLIAKIYVAVGIHPSVDQLIIFTLRPLFPQIVAILESANAPWTWFTGVRIGYGSRVDKYSLNSTHPLVLLLNVEYGTTFEGIAGVTRTIKNLLDQHKVPVHVEVRENTLHDHGASSGLPQHQNVPTLEAVVQDNKNWMVNGKSYDNRLERGTSAPSFNARVGDGSNDK
ncbi:hypothetical protein PG995_004392 [Apiospora arundinis]